MKDECDFGSTAKTCQFNKDAGFGASALRL